MGLGLDFIEFTEFRLDFHYSLYIPYIFLIYAMLVSLHQTRSLCSKYVLIPQIVCLFLKKKCFNSPNYMFVLKICVCIPPNIVPQIVVLYSSNYRFIAQTLCLFIKIYVYM